ncbi:hypothetical protein PCANC_12751 [Puccinia coronata f. sp. avenae]|uniref:Uncharacterized protein n=1 Tax=Puccinia coronata f. sp. avenae TaxID=200324 RepID=A0A2N5VJR1_9BASI|nr:hypothetical protein PCANC_12751 [Puccinia coronata f. sp. avenae]
MLTVREVKILSVGGRHACGGQTGWPAAQAVRPPTGKRGPWCTGFNSPGGGASWAAGSRKAYQIAAAGSQLNGLMPWAVAAR